MTSVPFEDSVPFARSATRGCETPATASPAAATGTITNLISGILDDGKTLAKQQMEMLKSEVREDIQKSIMAAQFGAVAAVFSTVGILGLITAIAYVLHEQAGLKMWVSWGIIGLIFLGIGLTFALLSTRIIAKYNPLPDKTFTAIKENLTWTPKA
jgi:uncharacterized membrane protein YqjE